MTKSLPQTRHFRIARTLREELKRIEPAGLLPTQEALKRRFQVSQATVERALAQLQAEGLIYRPAGRKRLVRAEICDPAVHRISIIRPDWPSLVLDAILQAVVQAGRDRDWAFNLVHYRHEQGFDLDRVIGDSDGAVLMLTPESLPAHWRQALQRPRKPIVLAQDEVEGMAVSSVCSDDREMARLAVEHLADLGHRRIALLLPTLATAPMRAARDGWMAAMQQVLPGQPLDALLIDSDTPPFCDPKEAGYEAFSRWLAASHEDATAVYCASFGMGMAAGRTLYERNIVVPDDMSLVLSDGLTNFGPYGRPPLTTTGLDLPEYGRTIVQLLEQSFHGESVAPHQVRVGAFLTVRESTAWARVSNISSPSTSSTRPTTTTSGPGFAVRSFGTTTKGGQKASTTTLPTGRSGTSHGTRRCGPARGSSGSRSIRPRPRPLSEPFHT